MRSLVPVVCLFVVAVLACGVSFASLSLPASVPLLADKTVQIGTVDVSLDGSNLIVTYNVTEPNWGLLDTHLYVGRVAPTKAAPGKFAFKHGGLAGATTDTYTIPLNDVSGTLYLAAQADAIFDTGVQDRNGNEIFHDAGAWAAGTKIMAKGNWATYFSVVLPPV
ncbi:MAG TPA: hypothetical protein VGM19_13555 [Armatimonadota bacterium]|jgi:hypothetical protein